jgi:prevent-host-death family protein
MEKTISVTDANREFSKLIKAVKKGKSFVVLSHGEAVAKIIPVDRDKEDAERKKEEFIEYLRAKPVRNIGRWTRDELYEDVK